MDRTTFATRSSKSIPSPLVSRLILGALQCTCALIHTARPLRGPPLGRRARSRLMSPLSSFAQYAVELLSSVGPVKARAMFGGYGLSLEGVSIGLIADDRIYLRADDLTRSEFQAAGSGPFIYQSRNGPMTMANYFALPEDSVDDPDKAARWGGLAAEAARRAGAAKAAKAAASKPRPGAKAPRRPAARKSRRAVTRRR